jgi:acetoin utilization deacetylase AcuC-like enzyme
MRIYYNDRHPLHHGRHEMFRGELVRYLDFLSTAWQKWIALDPRNAERDALPSYWPIRTFRSDVLPASFPARMGLFSFDAGSPITAGTWEAARQGGACAAAAARALLAGERAAFALTRPPGHHAGHGFFGGYCFVNNAAVAAQVLRDGGMQRVAVLDSDYHHGNGTQAIAGFQAEALVVSLGLDTFEGDPISGFGLRSDDYLRVGDDLAAAKLPTAFVFEGGYAVAEVGRNAVNVLEGFRHGAG